LFVWTFLALPCLSFCYYAPANLYLSNQTIQDHTRASVVLAVTYQSKETLQ
jgi:hypothetical protein